MNDGALAEATDVVYDMSDCSVTIFMAEQESYNKYYYNCNEKNDYKFTY